MTLTKQKGALALLKQPRACPRRLERPEMNEVIHFHAGTNDPGYLPDELPATLTAWEDAQRFIIGELLSDADSVATWNDEHDCDDIPCPTYGDERPEGRASELTFVAEELNLSSGPDWSTITAGRSYWIHSCGCAPGQAELAEESEDEKPDLVALEAEALTRKPRPEAPKMTRAHFAFIADLIADLWPDDETTNTQYVAECFADALRSSNPRFDRDRFVKAATAS